MSYDRSACNGIVYLHSGSNSGVVLDASRLDHVRNDLLSKSFARRQTQTRNSDMWIEPRQILIIFDLLMTAESNFFDVFD
jgi:hypothetical protein